MAEKVEENKKDIDAKKKSYYITTPIYYPSDKLHIGHSYTTVASDTMARYKRMRGYDVMFLTGTDEHGQKIQKKAEEKGVTPKAFVDEIVDSIKDLWTLMNISYDDFIRTTDERHKTCVQYIFQKLYDQGDIYKGEYEGWYCVPCESFWTESQLVDGTCPDCCGEVHKTKEESYFFRLSKYQDRIIELFEQNQSFVEPKSRANEMLNNFLKPGLADLAVSRTSFSWGIPVPFDQKHVIYVWIDALVNYISALGYPEKTEKFELFWPASVHLVGKEIFRFHTIIWPALLMALNLPLPKQVYGHGWLLISGGKMSKRTKNVVDPVILCDRYGVDAIRYFLLREVPFGSDGNFTNQSLISRINTDLANDLGNLVSRTTAMINKYFDGVLPAKKVREPIDDELIEFCINTVEEMQRLMDELEFSLVLSQIWKLIGRANKYIDETTPWLLIKDETKHDRLATVLFNLLEAIRFVSIMIKPFMPTSSDWILDAIGINKADETKTNWASLSSFGKWKTDKTIVAAKPLFPRLDVEAELQALDCIDPNKQKKLDVQSDKKQHKTEIKNDKNLEKIDHVDTKKDAVEGVAYIEFTDFTKVSLVVGTIKTCKAVEGSNKLLCSTLCMGNEERQIVSGIATSYLPEELVGKQVICVANLKPRKIFGIKSEGMLLCAEDKNTNQLRLLTVDQLVEDGSVCG